MTETNLVTVTLIDGVERAAAHPATFSIPEEATRETLKIGDYAKIGLETFDQGGERFWVKIAEVRTEQDQFLYAGAVDNDLQVFCIPLGELIEFDPQHVLDVLPAAN